jgi:hypothetical protein
MSPFSHSPEPMTLNVIRAKGRSSFFFVLPAHLKIREMDKALRCCAELCDKHGFQFESHVDGDLWHVDKNTPQLVAKAVSWRRRESVLQSFLTEILRQSISLPVITVVRQ